MKRFFLFVVFLALTVIFVPGLRPVHAEELDFYSLSTKDMEQMVKSSKVVSVSPDGLTVLIEESKNQEQIGKEVAFKLIQSASIQRNTEFLNEPGKPFDLSKYLKPGTDVRIMATDKNKVFSVYWTEDETQQQVQQQAQQQQVQPEQPVQQEKAEHTAKFYIGKSYFHLDGQQKQMDASPYIKNGRIFVPLRFTAYAVGVADTDIGWSNNTATLTKGDAKAVLKTNDIMMQVNGELVVRDILPGGLNKNNDRFYLNDRIEMDVIPELKDGRVYLPAKWVAMAFGYEATWDSTTKTVTITYTGKAIEPVARVSVPERPRAMYLGFKPGSPEVVLWNYVTVK